MKPTKNKAFWPLIGFVLAVAIAAIAWALAPSVVSFLGARLKGFPRGPQMNLYTTIVLFFMFGGVASLIVAAAMPKKKSQVKETDLVKERKQMMAEKAARKKRQQMINKDMKSR
jgi:mannitol-specific phosphotransferase system IIBC component